VNTRTAKKVYGVVQAIRDENVFEKLRYLEKTQWLSRREIEDIQIRKLRDILIFSLENVPYYQKTLQPYSNTIHNLTSASEINVLPFLTKQEIQSHFNELQSTKCEGKTAIENTSGSTGDPFKFKLDRNASSFNRALSYREHRWYGLDVGAKEARFYGIPMDFFPNMKERAKDFLMNRKRFTVFDLSPDKLYEYHKKINNYKPDYIYGYTSSVFEFVRFMKLKGLKLSTPFLKAIIVTSEVLFEEDRKLMESYLQVPVVNEYGTSELGIIAAQCPQGNMHLSSENVIVEIIKNDEGVANEEEGEVVLSGLNNYAMPFIRYRVGDVASLANGQCPCGRGLPILKKIDGRINNMVVTPEGKIASGLVFYYISRSLIEKKGGVNKFKVIQHSLDNITFQIVKGPNFDEKSLKILEEKTHEYLSRDMNVKFEFLENLPPTTNGKIIHFISKLNSPLNKI
jgi:phenylacetate-CoA ligase